MSFIAVAAGISVVGNIISSNTQADAIQSASDAQSATSAASLSEQARQFDLSRSDFAPFLEAGKSVLPALTAEAGTAGTPSALYKYQLKWGLDALDKYLAARGMYNSGAGNKQASDFIEQLGANEAQNQWNRQLQLAAVGQGAAGQSATAGANAANNIANIYNTLGTNQANLAIAGGNARAGLYQGINNQVMGGVGTYLNYLNQQKLLDTFNNLFNSGNYVGPSSTPGFGVGSYA